MYKVVLLRHGESDWNRENRFTGWTDVDLSDKGRGEGPLFRAEHGPQAQEDHHAGDGDDHSGPNARTRSDHRAGHR